MFEGSEAFGGMFEYFWEIGVIASFPLWFPGGLEHFEASDEVAMYEAEVEGICSIFRDILEMAVDEV